MSKSVLSAGQMVRDALLADAEIQAAVGTNIFPLAAPNGTKGDYILYAREDGGEEPGQMGNTEETATVTLNVNSVDYDRGLEIAEMVRRVLMTLRKGRYGCKRGHDREDVAGLTDKGQLVYTQILEYEFSDTLIARGLIG